MSKIIFVWSITVKNKVNKCSHPEYLIGSLHKFLQELFQDLLDRDQLVGFIDTDTDNETTFNV